MVVGALRPADEVEGMERVAVGISDGEAVQEQEREEREDAEREDRGGPGPFEDACRPVQTKFAFFRS